MQILSGIKICDVDSDARASRMLALALTVQISGNINLRV